MRTQALSACGQSGANALDVIHRVGDETVLRMFHALGSEPGAEPGMFVTRSLCQENFDTVYQYLDYLDGDELEQLEAYARQESLLTFERFEGETESSAISGGREVPGDDGSHHQGQTDTKNDTKKRPKKPRRRMNTSAYDCARRYKDRRKKDSTTALKSVVEDYVEEVGADKAGTVEGILKRLEAHPEEWKSPDDNRHGTDT